MRPQPSSIKAVLWITVLTLAVSAPALAQTPRMGGGMMGQGHQGTPSSPNVEDDMHQNQGAGHGMGDALMGAMNMGMGGREMMDGPAVGPDGTAYVLRSVAPLAPGSDAASQTQFKHELIAVSPRDGSARWKLEIAGGMLSDPVVAKDGRIFLTLADCPISTAEGNGTMHCGGTTQATKSKLLIVTAEQNIARIAATAEVESDVLSSPKIATDETGDYVVYVTGLERHGLNNTGSDDDSIAAGEKHLYAFSPDGQLRFRLKLRDAGVGLPAN